MVGAADIPAFRSMRTLRALRPLRAVSRWEGMKVSSRTKVADEMMMLFAVSNFKQPLIFYDTNNDWCFR